MWDVSETRGSIKTPVAVYICLHSLDIFRLQCLCHGHGQDLDSDDILIYQHFGMVILQFLGIYTIR
jgi:hypothetical protein